MLTAVVLLAACAAAAPADKPTPPADVFDSPEFKAKVAIEQAWLASLPPVAEGTVGPSTAANSTNVSMWVSRSLADSAVTRTVVYCSQKEDNPLTCKFVAPSSGNYYFVFYKASGLAVSVIGAVSIDHAYVGKKVGFYWNNCCDSTGGPGHGECKWDGKEVLRYTATCSGGSGYNGLAVNLYLRSGESVQVLPSGTSYGFN